MIPFRAEVCCRSMTEDSWRNSSREDSLQEPEEVSSAIAARLQELSQFVNSEIECLAGSMKKLQEENQELRDQLSVKKDSTVFAQVSVKKEQSRPSADPEMTTIVDLDGHNSAVPREKATGTTAMGTTVDCDRIDDSVRNLLVDVDKEPMLRFSDTDEGENRLSFESFESMDYTPTESTDSEEFEASASGAVIQTQESSVSHTQSMSDRAKRSIMRKTCKSKHQMSREYTCLDNWKLETWYSRHSDTIVTGNTLTDTDTQFNMIVSMLEDKKNHQPHTFGCDRFDPYMVSPLSTMSVAIDLASFILIAYDCAAVPMLLLQATDATEHPVVYAMTWISRIFWTLAIPRSFMTGFMKDDGTIEMRAPIVFQEYRNTWLLLDVLVVAADWLDAGAGGMVRFARLLKAARLARMVRVPTLIVRRLNHASSEKMLLWLSIIKSTMSFLILNHFIACIWYWIGTLNDELGWVAQLGVENAGIMNKYGYAVHWSASQFIGSTEVFPKTGLERSFGALVMLFAFIWSASFISRITAAMTRLQILAGQKSMLFSSLRQFLSQSKLTKPLQIRVMSAARHNLALKDDNQPEGDVELLKYVSEPMLIEIHYELHSGVLMQHPFFLRFNNFEPLAVQKLCHSAIDILTLGVGDVLFTQGVEPTNPRMFFPTEGVLLYIKDLDGDGKIDLDEIVHVMHPMWVCEPVLWMKWMHMGNLRAAQHCSVLALSAERFGIIVQEYRNTNYPAEYATRMVKKVNLVSQKEDVDDLCEGIDCKELVAQSFPRHGGFHGPFNPTEWGKRLSRMSLGQNSQNTSQNFFS